MEPGYIKVTLRDGTVASNPFLTDSASIMAPAGKVTTLGPGDTYDATITHEPEGNPIWLYLSSPLGIESFNSKLYNRIVIKTTSWTLNEEECNAETSDNETAIHL